DRVGTPPRISKVLAEKPSQVRLLFPVQPRRFSGKRLLEPEGYAGRDEIPVAPRSGSHVEMVQGQESPAVLGHEKDRPADEIDLVLRVQEVEVHPRPPGLQADVSAHDGAPQLLRLALIDMEDPVAVWSGAGAARAALDPEQVVEEGGDEPGVQPGGADAH